jgi:hypothetical protein
MCERRTRCKRRNDGGGKTERPPTSLAELAATFVDIG